jgi:hypothetical protein
MGFHAQDRGPSQCETSVLFKHLSLERNFIRISQILGLDNIYSNTMAIDNDPVLSQERRSPRTNSDNAFFGLNTTSQMLKNTGPHARANQNR